MPDDRATSASPFHAILGWAETWPLWQRDALRRIIRAGGLSTEDLLELKQMCLRAHDLVVEGVETPEPQPVTEADLPTGPDATSSVTLVRLSEIANVNRLTTGQVIDFGPATGLTIVFGENGSGKSGYARVVKKACRARGSAPDIKANALAPAPAGPPVAKITFRAGGAEVEASWRDGVPCDPRLANVFVFDASSAASHVGSDEPATFTPRGLDVLPKLAEACDQLKSRIKDDLQKELDTIGKARLSWRARPGTPVGKLLARLGEDTEAATIEAMATFTEDDRKRLAEIIEALRSDPRRKAQDTAAKASRIRAFATLVSGAATALAELRVNAAKTAISDHLAAEQAARAMAGPRFDASYLPGTGGDGWRRLWATAEDYSRNAAYPGRAFPAVEPDARCVLCQRTLDEEARTRFEAFTMYMRDATRAAADEARRRIDACRDEFARRGPLEPEGARVAADLGDGSPELREAVKAFVESADARLVAVQNALKSLTWTDPPSLPLSPATLLEKLAAALDERSRLELSADDPEERKKLVAEREALEDRDWLVGARTDVLDILGRHRVSAALGRALNDTTTNQITIRGGELQERLVTQALCDAFNREVRTLGLVTLPVEMKSLTGAKGTKPFGIRLSRGTGGKVVGIASEGEERCVAIAAFLAELSQASHRSALVFDDPVSSLDHARRTAVAKRLVEEAKTRQVVVFTHDCVFLSELLDAAEEAKLAPEARHLFWNGDTPGFCEKGLPWDWQKYKERINGLEVEQRQLAATWSVVPNPANVSAMRIAYSHLRATVERVLQDVIFNGVISRFRSWIRVDNIEGVVGFTDAECREVMRLHKKACEVTEAHDPATGRHAPVPSPPDLKADIEAMQALVEQVKQRRRAATPAPVAPPPAPAGPATAAVAAPSPP